MKNKRTVYNNYIEREFCQLLFLEFGRVAGIAGDLQATVLAKSPHVHRYGLKHMKINEDSNNLVFIHSPKFRRISLVPILRFIFAIIFVMIVKESFYFLVEPVPYKPFFIVILLMIFIYLGSILIFSILYEIIGKEILIISKEHIIIRKKIGLYRSTKEYKLSEIHDLKIAGKSNILVDFIFSVYLYKAFPFAAQLLYDGIGLITFKYKKRIISWGYLLSQTEGNVILDKISKRFNLAVEEI